MDTMTNTGLSAGDILALAKDNDGMFGGSGVGFIILLFIFIWAVFGNGTFGNGGNGLTQAELQMGLYNQTTNADLNAIKTQLCSNNTDMLTNVLQNRYDNALQTQTLSSQMSTNALQAQASQAQCCCDIKGLIRDEAQGIKDLINANTIQDLRDAKAGYELVAALGNQTNTLTSRFGTFYTNPPYVPYNPYYYGNYYGTTIQ